MECESIFHYVQPIYIHFHLFEVNKSLLITRVCVSRAGPADLIQSQQRGVGKNSSAVQSKSEGTHTFPHYTSTLQLDVNLKILNLKTVTTTRQTSVTTTRSASNQPQTAFSKFQQLDQSVAKTTR